MRILFLLLLLLWQAVTPSLGQAQCLSLDDLLAIVAEPTALTAPSVVTGHLSAQWSIAGPTATSRDVFWALQAPAGVELPTARLQMRAQRPGQDVVLKTSQAACVRQLRSDLKNRKLTALPVTCPECEAVRFEGVDFEATIYSQMKGDYLFIVVVHRSTLAEGSTPATPGATGQVALPLPAIEPAAAARLLADPQVTVLDLRTPEEYAIGHLQGAQNLNFRALDFSQQLAKLNPKGRYLLYCATSSRSGLAAALMQQQGIANVTNVGSYAELRAAGAK